MERYTIEDIEMLRRKSGISYEEAVNLLEYHNGNLARALVDLERSGRINPQADNWQKHANHSANAKKAGNFFGRMYRFRLMIKKGNVTILNLSLLFSLVALLISPHLMFLSLLLILVLGYRITFDTNSADFATDNLESMVKNAAQNVKTTVSGLARDISGNEHAKQSASAPKQTEERSFYQSQNAQPAPAAQTPSAPPSHTTPVSVQYQDEGKVEMKEDDDGYHEATIE
jgi:hypothetical protein